ncbi:hypothetical protein OIV83_004240 [Microbotryomycetes sp. JL201]|nr:hypothetical protein OIV83_004240 [Microbotryomycetes sp. JL201]
MRLGLDWSTVSGRCVPPEAKKVIIRDGDLGDQTRFGPSLDPNSPLYIATVLVQDDYVVPGSLSDFISSGSAQAPLGGDRKTSNNFNLLPFTEDMSWVDASGGQTPAGCTPIVGGVETDNTIYHGRAIYNGAVTLGKCGGYLAQFGGEFFAPGAQEGGASSGYQMSCWNLR